MTYWPKTDRPLEDTCYPLAGFQFCPSGCSAAGMQHLQPLVVFLDTFLSPLFSISGKQAGLMYQPWSTQQSQTLPNNHIRIKQLQVK